MDNNATWEVLEITKINFEGNIIPHNWYSQITRPNGKPDINAIIILAEIVYWYRGIPVKDEASGKFLGYKKKFKEEMFQRSYKAFENQFGFSKKQIRTALIKLEEMGLIKRVFKNIELENNAKITNMMYIEINPEKIAKITVEESKTYLPKSKEVFTKKETGHSQKGNTSFPENSSSGNTSFPKRKEVIPKKEIPSFPKSKYPLSLKGNTYTEIINTEIINTENTTGGAKKHFAPEKISEPKIDDTNYRKTIAEKIYEQYASYNKESDKHRNKERAIKNISKLLHEYSEQELKAAAKNYSEYRVIKHIHEHRFIKDPANFYGQRKDNRYFEDFLPGRYEKLEQIVSSAVSESESDAIEYEQANTDCEYCNGRGNVSVEVFEQYYGDYIVINIRCVCVPKIEGFTNLEEKNIKQKIDAGKLLLDRDMVYRQPERAIFDVQRTSTGIS